MWLGSGMLSKPIRHTFWLCLWRCFWRCLACRTVAEGAPILNVNSPAQGSSLARTYHKAGKAYQDEQAALLSADGCCCRHHWQLSVADFSSFPVCTPIFLLQGTSRPVASDWGCSMGPPCYEAFTEWLLDFFSSLSNLPTTTVELSCLWSCEPIYYVSSCNYSIDSLFLENRGWYRRNIRKGMLGERNNLPTISSKCGLANVPSFLTMIG